VPFGASVAADVSGLRIAHSVFRPESLKLRMACTCGRFSSTAVERSVGAPGVC
jgi:hypothetical protein